MLRGNAVTLALLVLTSTFGYVAMPGLGGADDPHSPIQINGDSAFAACACVRSGAGTAADPYVISDWRIVNQNGPAIHISNVRTTHFVIRDNTVKGDTGIVLKEVGDRGQIIDNEITFNDRGIKAVHASPRIVGNILQAPVYPWYGATTAIHLAGGSPLVKDNFISRAATGVWASSSSPEIVGNELVENSDAVILSDSTDARLEENTIRLARHWGLVVRQSAKATLIDNEVREGKGGVIVQSATLYMEGNRVMNQRQEAVRFENAVVTMVRNDVSDNWRGAYGSTDSDVLLVNNTFTNNRDAGIRLTRSEGTVQANQVHLNGIGIAIEDSIITLKDNRMENNEFGLSIPYSSRQSIPLMSGNVINGINVDGHLDASQKRIFYKATGVVVQGQTIDSGQSQGYYGTTMEQGALVVYDSVDVTIQDNRIAYNDRGVHVRSSSYVNIQGNVFFNNDEGATTRDSRTFIKENECIIEIDPPETICFEAAGGFVSVRANVIANVEVGIRFQARGATETRGVIEGNTVTGTQVAVELNGEHNQGKHNVEARFNLLEENVVGFELITFRGKLSSNLVANNSEAGIELRTRSNATLQGNRILFNGVGVIDRDECSPDWRTRCSGGLFIDNRIAHNHGVGVELHNGGQFQGDIITHNRVGVVVEGRASLHHANVSHNQQWGVKAQGYVKVDWGNYTHNGQDGLHVTGAIFGRGVNASGNGHDGLDIRGHAQLRGSQMNNNSRVGVDVLGTANMAHGNFTFNGKAGLRLNGTLFRVFDCNVSKNGNGVIMAEALVEVHVQVPSVGIPDVPELPAFPPEDEETDPLWLNECNIVGNANFGLSASVNSIVNATLNYWGQEGPKVHVPLVPRTNSIQAAALISPYWKDPAHRDVGFVPTTAVGPDTREV